MSETDRDELILCIWTTSVVHVACSVALPMCMFRNKGAVKNQVLLQQIQNVNSSLSVGPTNPWPQVHFLINAMQGNQAILEFFTFQIIIFFK